MKKPKLLITVSKKEQLNLKADGYIVGYSVFTSFGALRFSFEEIKELSKDKNLYILLNTLIHEDNLQKFKDEVGRLINLNVSFIVQDLGGLSYILSKYPHEKVILNPYTLICNRDDLLTYNKLFDVVISITDNLSNSEKIDLIKASNKTMIMIYGTYPIYQSYRKVISLYEDYKKIDIARDALYLREDTRNDLYPITENEYGSFIFSHEKVNLADRLDELENAEYFVINTFNCSHEEILDIYKKVGEFYE